MKSAPDLVGFMLSSAYDYHQNDYDGHHSTEQKQATGA